VIYVRYDPDIFRASPPTTPYGSGPSSPRSSWSRLWSCT